MRAAPPDQARATTRRAFLGGALVLVCAAPLGASVAGASCAEDGAEPGRPARIGPWEIPPGTTLSPERYALLCALLDALVPCDESSPGATEAHAAWYVDQFLGAFRCDPPRIFAGGPYSGRHGGRHDFVELQPLTRVEAIRWRTFIEGSQGIPEREWAGPVARQGPR
ncbi:MAG: hypothetical protein HY744_33195 [Deltaproteobacteria bacterium]|nr:hypothetical protein [Deltaproteobacteria bacterium]